MRLALEGSQAIAKTVALCRPGVVAAYPITPQTHIVENISKLVADGEFDTELVSVESEFSAASVVLGAAAAGSRSYTATSSQGILLMSEVLFNIAGQRIPMVLTCANRAVSAPLSIWNDHQDSMAVRDSGWIQIHCADNQEAVDTTIQAFRISEQVELPVMVCMDGFVLTHTLETVDMPEQALVDEFLPPYKFSRMLDPQNPISLGMVVTPAHFTEVRHAHHMAVQRALPVIEETDRAWAEKVGRWCGGLIQSYGPDDAEIAILTMGSTVGTLRAAQEAMQAAGDARKVKILKLRAYRPFPVEALRHAVRGVRELVVLERAVAPGFGGIVGTDVRAALYGQPDMPRLHNYAVGLGGRDVPMETLGRVLDGIEAGTGLEFAIIDVNLDLLSEEER